MIIFINNYFNFIGGIRTVYGRGYHKTLWYEHFINYGLVYQHLLAKINSKEYWYFRVAGERVSARMEACMERLGGGKVVCSPSLSYKLRHTFRRWYPPCCRHVWYPYWPITTTIAKILTYSSFHWLTA